MHTSVVALLGAALFEQRGADPEHAALAGILALLARASEGMPHLIEIYHGQLMVNGVEVSLSAPGAALIADALVDHDTVRLQLPAEMGPRHWREVVAVYGAPSAHFPTALDVQKALRVSLPATDVQGLRDLGVGSGVRAPVQKAVDPNFTARGGDLGEFSAQLSQLQKEGGQAVRERNSVTTAKVLLAMDNLPSTGSSQKAIVALERKRLVDPITLAWLIDEAASPTASVQIGEALQTFGAELIEPLVMNIAKRGTKSEKTTLMGIVGILPGLEMALVDFLRGNDSTLLRGAAEVAGYCRASHAVFPLAALLRHREESVRTMAWHALEAIGTPEAIDALNTPPL